MIYDFGFVNRQTVKFMIELINLIKKEREVIKRITILSQNLPHELMDEAKSFDRNLEDSSNTFRVEVNKYLEILGDFTTMHFPLGDGVKSTDKLELELKFLSTDKRNIAVKEINALSLDEADKILYIQNKFKLYYFSIWNSLEKRERFVVYDLAQDGLVNSKNVNVVNNLLQRGILIMQNNRVELFNLSFENFVLTIIDRQESLEYETEAKKTGNWSNLRFPLILIITTVFLFLFVTQQEMFKDMLGWIAALVATLPLLIRVLVGFSGFRFGKETSD